MLRWVVSVLHKHVHTMAGDRVHVFLFAQSMEEVVLRPKLASLANSVIPLTPVYVVASLFMLDIKYQQGGKWCETSSDSLSK
jgi:hypothetical protein